MMSAEKDIHKEYFITEGFKSNVIRPSDVRYYSQVHLVVKPVQTLLHKRPTQHIRRDMTARLTLPRQCRLMIKTHNLQNPKGMQRASRQRLRRAQHYPPSLHQGNGELL